MVSYKQFSEVPLPVPKLEEQQKIAACLSSLDALIAAHADKLDALKTHKKGLMQQLFPREGETVPRLRFPEFREAGEWQTTLFGKLLDIIDGDRGSNYPKAEEFIAEGFCLFLNAKNVTKDGFRFEELQFITQEKDKALRKGKLKPKDIILTTRGSVGQFAYFTENVRFENMRINSGMVILRVKTEKLIPEYVYVFSQSPYLASHIKTVAFGNAQQQLTVAGIKQFPISHPDIEEQQKIAACLSSLDALITAQADKLDALKTHKKGLMQQLFPNVSASSTESQP
jgi:type I restriction enzyme S subunit